MEVSNNIRTIRESKGLTQVDLANRLGTERSNYARLENRNENLTIKQLKEIATALEVSIYELLGKSEPVQESKKNRDVVQRLQDKLNTTEEILKDKKRNIKFYKAFIEWTRNLFMSEFIMLKLVIADTDGLGKKISEDADKYEDESYTFTVEELKELGDKMFEPENPFYHLFSFIGSSGFIHEKWFIEAYKKDRRKSNLSAKPQEAINWVKGVFDFLEDE